MENRIVDLPKGLKLVSKEDFLKKNAQYRLLLRDMPTFAKNSPMEIYQWVEKLIKLIKSV